MKTRGRPPHPDILTPREFEVLQLLREGLSNPEIAERLAVSRETVKDHVSEILGKLGLSNRQEAALWQRETPRPWWSTAALAPAAWLWGKAGAMAHSPGALAAGAAGVLVGASVAGLAFIAFLLATGGGDSGESAAASLLATATPPEGTAAADPYVVFMNEVGGSGANGTATLAGVEAGAIDGQAYFPTGLAPGEHPWAIMPGSCATQPFKTLGTDPAGYRTTDNGTHLSGYISSRGFGAVTGLEAVRDGFHYIAVYDLVANGGVVLVSCGDIPAVSPDDGTAIPEPPDLVHLSMNERGGSGVTGDVLLWTLQDGVGVAARTNAPGWHAVHIHSGSCATPGPIESFLEGMYGQPAVGGGYGGLAEATEPATIQDGNHYLDVHAEVTGGAVASCIDIPAGTQADQPTPARRTTFVQLTLQEEGGSGVSGDVVIWEWPKCNECFSAVGVAADIVAGSDQGPLAIHIHVGSCDAPEERYPENLWGEWEPPAWFDSDASVGVDAGKPSYQGRGAPLRLAWLRDGDHYIDIHVGDEAIPGGGAEGGAVLACADIPEA